MIILGVTLTWILAGFVLALSRGDEASGPWPKA